MKILHITTLLAIASTLFLSGCSDEITTEEKGIEKTSTHTLEARSIDRFSEKSQKYYGECLYRDGSSDPVLIASDNVIDEVAVSIAYIDPSSTVQAFTAYNEYGNVYQKAYGMGGTLIPNPIWDFSISEDKQVYSGYVNKGTLFECKLTALLNAQTKEQLEAFQ